MTPPVPDTAYGMSVANEALDEFVNNFISFKFSKNTLKDAGVPPEHIPPIDDFYQSKLDHLVDSLITAYESGSIENVINGLKNTMNKKHFVKTDVKNT